VFSLSHAVTINVPIDYPTIQAAIDAAAANDSVLVAPGTYIELLTLKDGVVVASNSGPSKTTITTPTSVYAIITVNGVGGGTVLSGFTIDGINGSAQAEKGIVTDNCTPLIESCVVSRFWGIGVHFDGLGTIRDCVVHSCDRAGIYAGAPTAYPTVDRCLIYGCGFVPYIASEGLGGHYGGSFFVRNTTFVGNYDGIYADIPSPSIVENCIVVNSFRRGIGVVGAGVINVVCSDVWNNGKDYVGVSPGQGCISADPLFCDLEAGNYFLNSTSPCAPANSSGCGLIGAYDVGCEPSSVETKSWGKIKGLYR
jgi:hypothetical protein